ncbi:hypothetical protein JTE90_027103 [Oedothorax gibbosus]|uniref:Transposable element P transposase-like RNase H domain-containing protein n=1 Tax=Oedothorax gibbosus TaxID=931172 RepID=A0AAV6TS77_9ARAC|nr:hypothetical protein JTE90_027103 [Oedothorax gibbosus]
MMVRHIIDTGNEGIVLLGNEVIKNGDYFVNPCQSGDLSMNSIVAISSDSPDAEVLPIEKKRNAKRPARYSSDKAILLSEEEESQSIISSKRYPLPKLPCSYKKLPKKIMSKSRAISHGYYHQSALYAEPTVQSIEKEDARLNATQSAFSVLFNEDQQLALQRKNVNNGSFWSDETVKTAMGLRFSCGSKSYEHLLRLNFPYPSIRTLQRRLENFKFESGILEEAVEFLKVKVAGFADVEKQCVLLLDEMSITESVEFET